MTIKFVYSFEPVATYFKMPWKYHLPNLSLKSDTAQAVFHLVSEAAPFVFHRAAGYAVMSFARMASQAYHLLYQQTSRWEKTKIGLDMFSTLSPLLMVISTIAPGYFIAAQAAKTGMELKENIEELKNFRQLSSDEISDRMLPVISHSFFLIALWRGSSYKIRLAAIFVQGLVSYYQTSKHFKNGRPFAGLIWGLIGTLRFYEGYRYLQFKTAAEPQFVYKQRHAEKQKDVKHCPLTDHGHEQARLAGPLVEKYLQEKTGRTRWTYASSTYLRSIQTAQGMLQGLGRPLVFFMDGRLGEAVRGETKAYRYDRHEAAIDDLNDEIALPDQGIISIDHSNAGKNYARMVDKTDEAMAKHHLKYAEGFLFKRQEGKTELLDRFLPKLS
jgi:broad specificity phosphatase PhoE